ncbi:MAG: hypothetical protein NTW06_04115, partial [Candidatus Falkowbacteria bacterium]|nr:hypothetical protein [Candidatus Falkowbacteria bacterium]
MKIFNKKILYSIFLLIFIGSIFIAIPQPARAEIPVIAPTTDAILLGKTIKDTANTVKEWTWRALVEQLQKMGAQAFSTALRSAMQKIAYDSATWLGSGGHGQKPMFITEGWGPYLNNIADDTAGTFIEEIGKTGISGVKFNLCEPNLSVKISVGLGLIEYQRPSPPACTFSKMRDNWEQALEDPQFLNKFQDMFNPTSNDLGYSLIMYQKMIEQKEKQTGLGVYGRLASGGWLNISPIIESGNSVAGSLVGAHSSSYPQYAAAVATLPWTIAEEALGKDFGNSLVNATNVFLNQYFLTLLRTKLSQIGRGAPSYTSPYSGNYGGLTKAEANPSNGGIQAAKEKLKKIIEPNFTEKADYNILVELTSCPNPVKAGPTNCVISEKFSQAVQLKKTVGEAMKDGYLDPNGIFGFTSNGQEPDYKQGYPYRSMIILRKYRILPVGWELAAQYIKDKAMNESGSGETLNLKDLVDCFDPSDDNYVGYAANWCQGLVDPNWVLKAPQNYCKRQGAGPEILSSEVTTKTEENGDTSPRKWNELMISRNETYCGDEQSCIKENKDGSCKLYGYCIEDKRKWKFDSDSCDSIYNTCMTFSNSQDNSSISYLQNTLDYANCSADNAGCQAYCEDYNYASSRYTCTADAGNKIYLDRDVVECDASNEGCHEFIRTKEGLGANLLLNGGFENDTVGSSVTAAAITYLGDWQLSGSDATIVDSSTGQVHSGNQSLHIAANADSGLEPLIVGAAVHPVVPVDLRLAEGEVLTLSVWVYPISGSVMLALGNSATTWVRATSTVTNQWEKLKVTLVNSGINTNQFLVYADGAAATFYVDDIQLEKGQSATAYSSYRQRGLVYEKLLPAYLYSACYSDSVSGNYSLRANHPAICDNYVRLCNQDEAGCEMYTGVVDKISVPAKITTDDKCPQVCVGYDQYLQAETYFDSARTALFIPQLGTKCSAEMAGCDEFTNLDKLAQGGESREYYTYIRQCIKPGDSCAEFYTWEGSDETGYQLKVHSLQNGAGNSPFVTSDDSGECNVDIYNYAPDEPGYNADCTEFYNRAGDISYHLYTRTISCSDDCHPYRRTEKNTDPSITESVCGANCSAADGATTCWDSATGACNFCRNNGTWSVQHQACIYMAIPSEGRVCSAAMAGCREFSGNSGSNMRIVVNSNFEGSTEGWTGNFDPATNPSNEALRLGGHSLNVNQVGHT